MSGNVMRDLGQYNTEWNDSFEFKFVKPSELDSSERKVFDRTGAIFDLAGGRPGIIGEIAVSETMRREESGVEAVGLWEPDKKRIVIKRGQLGSLEDYAGTLLHEACHATSGAGDVSREFESGLTDIIGKISAKSVDLGLKRAGE